MKNTPQQLEEMLAAWEEHQSTPQLELPSAEIIPLRTEKPAEVSSPQTLLPEQPVSTSPTSAGLPSSSQGSNPITDFGGDILPRQKLRKNLRRRKVELSRDPSTGDISGFTVYDQED